MKPNSIRIFATLLAIVAALASKADADPCGMVPPIYIESTNTPLTRIGLQKTYVFYKEGLETLVIRPGFTGNVEDFGMLIPLPTPPAIRKVSDDIFPHIAAAIDPPEVVIDLRATRWSARSRFSMGNADEESFMMAVPQKSDVRVIREEAVGMYEVVVLDAGSANALKRWMDDHEYRYPVGMDKACEDYVRQRWCFVAVKTRVGRKSNVDPQPGQRDIDTRLTPGASFDGHVQAMGFRFRSKQLVVPMRLSTFNKGDLHNVVYLLTDRPSRINSITDQYVVRQLPGDELLQNLTGPLPLRILGGKASDIREPQRSRLKLQRDPEPHNGLARELFSSDLVCTQNGRLANEYEETEKELLLIGELLNLRGAAVDRLHHDALKQERQATTERALFDLEEMTMTVIDGDFPRELLARENLAFSRYVMPDQRNSPVSYDARLFGPGGKKAGTVTRGKLAASGSGGRDRGLAFETLPILFGSLGLLSLVAVIGWRQGNQRATLIILLAGCVTVALLAGRSQAGEDNSAKSVARMLRTIEEQQDTTKILPRLVKMGEPAIDALAAIASSDKSLTRRGWAIVCLEHIGGPHAKQRLEATLDNTDLPLVRIWASAARVNLCSTVDELLKGSWRGQIAPLGVELGSGAAVSDAINRPIAMRLEELLANGDEPASLSSLVALSARHPFLSASVTPAIREQGSKALIQVMLTDKDQLVRRQAAAFLGSLATGDKNDAIADALLAALECSGDKTQVPWAGGPLFLPSMQWEQATLQNFNGQLLAWWLWCEHHNKQVEFSMIANNLASLATLSGGAIYGNRLDLWLFDWGSKTGPESLQQLLDDHAATGWQSIVDQLRLIASAKQTSFAKTATGWEQVGLIERDNGMSQVVFHSLRDPPTAWIPTSTETLALLEEEVWQKASVDGKYKNLLHVIERASDERSYGKFRDYGYWTGTTYGRQNNLSRGYWVYASPNWYIWKELGDQN